MLAYSGHEPSVLIDNSVQAIVTKNQRARPRLRPEIEYPDVPDSYRAVLRTFGRDAAGAGGIVVATALAVVKLAAMVALTFVVGQRVVPRLLTAVAATRSRELFTLTVLVVALGVAVGSAKLFGVSMALGSFLAGMAVGRSEFSQIAGPGRGDRAVERV